MEYRREIDGLRAVAVIPVILFHAGFSAFSGGFVGVDVFFVISGYLITSIILHEKNSGRFTIAGFYERRARRILPALFLVMLVCVPLAWMWMWPSEVKEFADSLIAVTTFVSNMLFWRERGYFDPIGELKPLLHTWSLAVEEQYYLLFPLFLGLILRTGRRATMVILIATGVASFTLASWMTVSGPGAAFFLLPTRAWEILIGAVIAFLLMNAETANWRSSRFVGELAGTAGIVLIGLAVISLDETTPFPGLWALLPTVGTGLIIAFATARTVLGRLLGTRILVGIGLISYSAYLWHQPMLAFARLRNIADPSTPIILFLCACVFPLAFLSWKFVEVPFRNRQRFSRKQIFAFALVGSACFVSLGLLTRYTPALSRKLPPNVEWEEFGAKLESVGDVCEIQPLDGYPGVLACYFGDQNSTRIAALYGDSHARAISRELNKQFIADHIKGVKLLAGGCGTVPGIYDLRRTAPAEVGACESTFRNVVRFIDANASDVIVSSRWTFFLYPIPGQIDELSFDNHEGGIERNSFQTMVAVHSDGIVDTGADGKKAALEHFMGDLIGLNKDLIVVYPVPEVGWDIAKLNWFYYNEHGEPLPEISTSYALYKERNGFVMSVFDEFQGLGNVHFVRPDTIFCNTLIPDRCVAQFNGVPLYYDDDHLSDAGAKLVVRDIISKMRGQN